MEFYRYEAVNYASIDDSGDYNAPRFPNPSLNLITLHLFKETPHGYWIGYGWDLNSCLKSSARWVSKTAKKRYAYPTKEEALTNYIKRTERRIKILSYQTSTCRMALKLAKNKLMANT